MWSIKFIMATPLFGHLLGVKSGIPSMITCSCLSPTLIFRVWFLIYGSLILIFGTWISFPPSLILRPFKLFPKLWRWTASTRTSFYGLRQEKETAVLKIFTDFYVHRIRFNFHPQDQGAYSNRLTRSFNGCGNWKTFLHLSRLSPGDLFGELLPPDAELQDIQPILMSIAVSAD